MELRSKAVCWATMILSAACAAAPASVDAERGKGGTGTVCDPALYPCGPYGFAPGSVIEDIELVARRDTDADGEIGSPVCGASVDAVSTVKLSDYYKDKTVQALLLTGSAEWCGPCRSEQPGLRRLFNSYQDKGGHLAILGTIVENNNHEPSDIDVADRWKCQYDLPFVVAADPAMVLQPYYDISAFPMNMLIRTSDMRIMWQINGAPPSDELKAQIDAILANPAP